MKTIILFISIISLILTSEALSQFRDFNWGSKKDSIISVIGEPEYDDEDMIAYNGEIADYDVYIYYSFIENRLHSGIYAFTDKYSNNLRYITEFNELKALLTKRYGNPTDKKSRFVLNPDTESNQYIDEGTKLSSGAIAYQSIWVVDKTEILLMLRGNNYEINLTLAYKSEFYDKLKEESKVSDF